MSSLLLLATILLAGCVVAGLARHVRSRSSNDATEEFSRAMSAITPHPDTRGRQATPAGRPSPRRARRRPSR